MEYSKPIALCRYRYYLFRYQYKVNEILKYEDMSPALSAKPAEGHEYVLIVYTKGRAAQVSIKRTGSY
jgi:hypothetical protein